VLEPPFQRVYPLVVVVVSGGWAALSLVVLLAGARQRYKLLLVMALGLAATLSVFTKWFGFAALLLAYFGMILFIGVALILAALRLLRRRPSPRALTIPIAMVLLGAAGILLSAWSTKPIPPIPTQAVSVGEELKYIYDTDQSDRFTGIWLMDLERDRIRLERVKALYRAGQITAPVDQYHAAWVYQHASCADDFKVAYDLARAAEGNAGVPKSFPPLSHLAYDRWQLSLGQPQTYGTKFPPVPIKLPCPPGQ
jgi:hypothetical protein